jgi:hypothetical protein
MPAALLKDAAATPMVIVPVELVAGVTTRVYQFGDFFVVVSALVPFVTVTAEAGKLLTGWLKVKVMVTGADTGVLVTPLMTTAGAGLKVGATAGAVALPPQLSIIVRGATRRAVMSRILCIRLVVIGSPWLEWLGSQWDFGSDTWMRSNKVKAGIRASD